ncbi:hypothetical protein OB919_09195 [Halobacteria archaeon AArc-curdl1]|uniref:Halobacterial output domain-containing protein n=1 Tax=Natronosalvus hydrolyticus TaxID=2979988 RepID=A0AAP3E665_9EURY|nr:hypothetical protein [Halobacteria archaeon AArc-curdl1]
MSSTYPNRSSGAVTHQIVQEIADSKEIDPIEVTPPLHSAIDVEALERLFASTKDGPRSGHVTFEYNDCTIQVSADMDTTVEIKDK